MSLQKKLHRSSKNKFLAGVCGGIAEYFDVDPTIVRLIWAISTVFFGIGIFIYIVAWIIMPER